MSIIYLVRKRAMGDVLWIEPIIKELAVRYNKVVVVTKNNKLFLNYPLPNVYFRRSIPLIAKTGLRIDSGLSSPLFFKQIDLAFDEDTKYPTLSKWGISLFFLKLDMAYERVPQKHILHAYQEKAGIPIVNVYPRIYLSKKERDSKTILDKYVVLHIASSTIKNYRKVYGIDWQVFVSHLQLKGNKVVVIGKELTELPGIISFEGEIRELIGLIYHSDFFIGIDSGPSHIAVSLKKPSIIFFGSVNPSYRHFVKDIADKTIIMQGHCEYAGCYHEVPNDTNGLTCRLVGDSGIPKCSFHSTEDLIANFDNLYQRNTI